MNSDAQYVTYCATLQFILLITLALTQLHIQYVGKIILFNHK